MLHDKKVEIVFKEGKYNWNLYFVSNAILFGGRKNMAHPLLVIDEIDGFLFGFISTHSSKVKHKRMVEIQNSNSKDTLPDGTHRTVYISLDPVYFYQNNTLRRITIKDLGRKVNDSPFKTENINKLLQIFNEDENILAKYEMYLEQSKKTR